MVKTITHQVVEFTSECEMVVVASFRDLEERKSEQYEIALKFAGERAKKRGTQTLVQEFNETSNKVIGIVWRSWETSKVNEKIWFDEKRK